MGRGKAGEGHETYKRTTHDSQDRGMKQGVARGRHRGGGGALLIRSAGSAFVAPPACDLVFVAGGAPSPPPPFTAGAVAEPSPPLTCALPSPVRELSDHGVHYRAPAEWNSTAY